MLQVIEFLDIEKIEDVRKRVLNKDLDEHDNFSFHAALVENSTVYGVARLYKNNGDIVIDNIAIENFANSIHYEMLFKALLNKSRGIECNYIIARKEKEQDFYLSFGFDKNLRIKPKDITFKCDCLGRKND